MKILIKNGQIYDPGQNCCGDVVDLAVASGRLVRPVDLGTPDRVIDANGLVVTAAAIESSAHSVPVEALLLQRRFGFCSPQETARRYAGRGYCHLHQNFVTIPTVATVLQQLRSQDRLDISYSLAVPLYDLESRLRGGHVDQAAEELETLLTAVRARNLYLVEPNLIYRLEVYRHKNLGAQRVLPLLQQIGERIGCTIYLPAANLDSQAIPLLGEGFHIERWTPGSGKSSEWAEDAKASGVTFDLGLHCEANALVRTWRSHPATGSALTFDYGFFSYAVWELLENDGFKEKEFARLLEQTKDHDSIIFSCAHANLALVSDWRQLIEKVLQHWSIDDWLRATRLNPARVLGMKDRGHLANGARADIAFYPAPDSTSPSAWSASLARCQTLIIDGKPIIEDRQEIPEQREPLHWGLNGERGDIERLSFLEEGMSLRRETLARLAGTSRFSASRTA